MADNIRISPQGYIYGGEPTSDNPFWGDDPQPSGESGATFTPHTTPIYEEDEPEEPEFIIGYTLSWTNDKGLPNPSPVDIMNGKDGRTYTLQAAATITSEGSFGVDVVTTKPNAHTILYTFNFTGMPSV